MLRPGNGTQEKSWPIETLFHKIVMIRNRLRMLEQQVNGMDCPRTSSSSCRATSAAATARSTSFNVLFADEDDQFKGAGGD